VFDVQCRNMKIPNPNFLVSQTFGKDKIEFVWKARQYWLVIQSFKNGKCVILHGPGTDFNSVNFKTKSINFITTEMRDLHDEAVAYLKSI
jgi:hypothetical protein